jgi:hypothetical protein
VARGGVRRAALLLLAALTAGLVVRATTSSVPVFVLGTVAVLSAIAVGNVLSRFSARPTSRTGCPSSARCPVPR